MFKNVAYASYLTAVFFITSPFASAATFDFIALENVIGEQGASSFTLSDGRLFVTATGLNTSSGAPYFAYLDGPYGGPGGLGVCQNLTSSMQCTPSSDDNITFDESLKLSFNQPVTIDLLTLRNGDHNQNFLGNFELSIDGGTPTSYGLTNFFNIPLSGTEFIFSNPNAQGGSTVSNEYQFYIGTLEVTAVPLPAALWLFLSSLFSLGMIGSRKA